MVAEALPPLETRLEAVARAQGFAAFGIARADAAPKTAERLDQWLAEGRHGGMIWMESRAEQRQSQQQNQGSAGDLDAVRDPGSRRAVCRIAQRNALCGDGHGRKD